MAFMVHQKILALVIDILNRFPGDVCIVVSGAHHMAGERDPRDTDFTVIRRALASDPTLLRSGILSHEDWLLRDGHVAVTITDPQTHEQFMLDDHKCLVTPDTAAYRMLFQSNGVLLDENMPILPSLPHQHNVFVGGAARMRGFCQEIAPWAFTGEE